MQGCAHWEKRALVVQEHLVRGLWEQLAWKISPEYVRTLLRLVVPLEEMAALSQEMTLRVEEVWSCDWTVPPAQKVQEHTGDGKERVKTWTHLFFVMGGPGFILSFAAVEGEDFFQIELLLVGLAIRHVLAGVRVRVHPSLSGRIYPGQPPACFLLLPATPCPGLLFMGGLPGQEPLQTFRMMSLALRVHEA